MKKFFFLAAISLFALTASADSWRIYRREASFVGGKFAETNKLPAGVKRAFRLPKGQALCVMTSGDPFLIWGNGGSETLGTPAAAPNPDPAFTLSRKPEYAPEGLRVNDLLGAAIDIEGNPWFFSEKSVCRYDRESKKWQGITASGGNVKSTLPALKCEMFGGMTFDGDGNMVVSGRKENGKGFLAVLKDGAWQMFEADAAPIAPQGSGNELSSPVACGDVVCVMQAVEKTHQILAFKDGRFEVLGAVPVNSIQSDLNGGILYTNDNEVGRVNVQTRTAEVLLAQPAQAVCIEAGGALWYSVHEAPTLINKPRTFLRRKAGDSVFDFTNFNSPVNEAVEHIECDAAGNVVMNTSVGVLMIDREDMSKYGGRWSSMVEAFTPVHDWEKANCVAMNSAGDFPVSVSWNITDKGIARYVGRYQDGQWNYTLMTPENEAPLVMGVKGTRPISVCNTSRGIIVGSANDGPLLFADNGRAANLPGYDKKALGDKVYAIAEASGSIWMGTNNGLVRWDGTSFELLNEKNKSGFATKKSECLYVDAAGTLWAGSNGDGLFSFDGTAWKNYPKKEVFKSGRINDLADAGGNVAVVEGSAFSAPQKIYLFNGGSFTAQDTPFAVKQLISDGVGGLWIVGSSSIAHRNADGSMKVFNGENSPIGKGEFSPQGYNLDAYAVDGKLRVRVERKGNIGDGSTPITEIYKDRMDTFARTIYSLE